MDRCDWLLSTIYIAAAAVCAHAIHVKSRASMTDIERYCMQGSVTYWYVYRASMVVVVFGGLMHARHLFATVLFDRVIPGIAARTSTA